VTLLDILVIGDKQHARATCVDWTEEIPNIEEFDLIIVALNELTQEVFNQIAGKFSKIAEEARTILATGRSVWCIIGEPFLQDRKKTPKSVPYPPPTNYDLLPIPIDVVKVKEGTSVIVESSPDAKKFKPFFDKVKGWHLEIKWPYHSTWPGSELNPLATNKSGKWISVVASVADRKGKQYLLPIPTVCDTREAIETLIDIATGEDRTEPEWRDQVEIPGILTIDTEISQHESEISAVQERIRDLKVKRLELDKYRNVFSVHEEPQVDAVRLVLKDVGFETQKTKPSFPVDLLGKDLAVEVTSIAGKVNSDSPKMFQLLQFFEKYRKNEKVILVANTFKREFPSNRSGKQDFTPQVIGYLQSNEVCAMTCVTLFELWKLAKKDQAKAQKYILQTNGELKV